MLVVTGVRGLSWHFVVVEITVVDGPQYHCDIVLCISFHLLSE